MGLFVCEGNVCPSCFEGICDASRGTCDSGGDRANVVKPLGRASCCLGVIVNVARCEVVGMSVMPEQGVVDCTRFGNVVARCGGIVSVHVQRSDGLRGNIRDEGGNGGLVGNRDLA